MILLMKIVIKLNIIFYGHALMQKLITQTIRAGYRLTGWNGLFFFKFGCTSKLMYFARISCKSKPFLVKIKFSVMNKLYM